MKTFKTAAIDVLLYLIIYIIIQFAVSISVPLIIGRNSLANSLILTLLCISVATIALFWLLKWTPISPVYLRERHWDALTWAFLMPIGLIIPLNLLQDVMAMPIPDMLREQSQAIAQSPWSIAVAGIIAPIAEEMVFRGAILRRLLEISGGTTSPDGTRSRRGAIVAVAVSALLFGLVHVNPAQIVNATLMGLLLGYLYVRTSSILPCVVVHCANNIIICIIEKLMPGIDDMTLLQLAGSETRVMLYVFFSLCVFLPALMQFHRATRR